MAKRLVHRYTFNPGASGVGNVVIEGNVHRRRLLLITNVTDNIPIYSFADRNASATSVTYDQVADETTVVLDYDTSGMSSSDSIQIFIEEDAVKFEPDETYTDPVSKFRVSEAETLIDTDFEYGLQATKWETLELVNNIPGFYSRTGDTPLEIESITGTIGSKNIIVTSYSHGLVAGTPIDIRGMNQPNIDGSYVIEKIISTDSFSFTARSEATIEVLAGDYTYLIPGRFYEGSQINYTSINTDGATPTSTVTVTTKYPNGFKANTEFYLINTLGYQTLTFDATKVDASDFASYATYQLNYTISAIESDASKFTVTLKPDTNGVDGKWLGRLFDISKSYADTGFLTGDSITISGVTPTAYNGTWTIANVDHANMKLEVTNAGNYGNSVVTDGRVYKNTKLDPNATVYTKYSVGLTATRATTTLTVTSTAAHNLTVGDVIYLKLYTAGTTLSATTGQYTVATVTSATIFTVTVANSGDSTFVSPSFFEKIHVDYDRIRVMYPWRYTNTPLSMKMFRAGSGGDITGSNIIRIDRHGFSANDPVALITGVSADATPTKYTAPTGLADLTRYYVKVTDANRITLSTTPGGADVTITSNSGSGIHMLVEGYAISAINATTDALTFNGTNTNTSALPGNTVPLVCLNGTNGTFGTALPAANVILVNESRPFWNDSVSFPAGDIFYFSAANSTAPTLRTAASGGGSLINFSLTTIVGTPILIPFSEDTTKKNTLYHRSHGFEQNDPVVYDTTAATPISNILEYTSKNISSIVWDSVNSLFTVTTATAHGLSASNCVFIDGVNTAYNGYWTVNTAPTTTTFTVKFSANAGTAAAVNGGNTGALGTMIQGYFVDKQDDNTFGLKLTTASSRVNMVQYGSGATDVTHYFEYKKPKANRDKIYLPAHGLANGDEVVYDSAGETEVGGLVDETSYYVMDAETDYFRLSTNQNTKDFINLTSAGTGSQLIKTATEGRFDGSYVLDTITNNKEFTLSTSNFTIPKIIRTFDPSTSVNTTDDYITLTAHRFVTGTPVTYSHGGGSAIGNLTDNTVYYVIRISRNRIKLSETFEGAFSQSSIDLSSVGTGTTHTLESANLAGETDGPGTVAIATDSYILTGTGTAFTRTYKAGDTIVINLSDSAVFETSVDAVLSDTSIKLIDPATSTASGLTYLLKTSLYIKSGAYGVHRPYDGGVEINAGLRADTQIVRQTRRYFRYQSGKGLNIQFAINFNPPIDITSLSSSGLTATVKTRRPNGLSLNQTVTIRDASVNSGTNYYNGTFTISEIVDDSTFRVTLSGVPADAYATGFPQLVVRDWQGAKMKAGAFDFQNGMFWEYDGTTLYAVRRNSTTQISGTVFAEYLSNEVTGLDTHFTAQVANGDVLVIRGQTYKVVNVQNNTTLHIQPAFRGVSASYAIASKVVDVRVPQSQFSIDPCDGTGPTGYVLDVTRIQMAYIDYSWYGAGKIRFGFKDQHGHVKYVHEFKHNNKQNKAFLRSGNLPARYEIENIGSPIFAPSLAHWGTTVQMDGKLDDDQAYLFTASSSFLTFAGTEATVTGTGNYSYILSDGSASNNVTTYTSLNASGIVSGNTPSSTRDTITFASNHGLQTGTLVQYFTSGTVPTTSPASQIVSGNYYYAIKVTDTSIRLATSLTNAQSNTYIDFTNSGNGTQTIRSNFVFVTNAKTLVPGYGSRIIHRFTTNTSGFASAGAVSFGTRIRSTNITNRSTGNAYVYRVIQGTGGAAIIDFFYENDATNALATGTAAHFINGPLIGTATSAAETQTLGTTQTVPDTIPLISVRLAPSVDGGLVGLTGHRDIINRMQLALDSVGLLTTHDMEVKLILNGSLNNVIWANKGVPSLTQLIAHSAYETVTGGTTVFTFRAAGNPPDASGKRTANAFTADISQLLSLGNCILGGDGVYPDGPDILTIAVSPLNTTGVTVNSPISISGRVSWSESQA